MMNIFEKIKLLWKVNKEFEIIKGAYMKQGWKSTEFWGTALASIGSIAGALSGIIPPELAAKITLISTSLYTLLRKLEKQPDITTLIDNRKIVQSDSTGSGVRG